jgi:hypothetical protein
VLVSQVTGKVQFAGWLSKRNRRPIASGSHSNRWRAFSSDSDLLSDRPERPDNDSSDQNTLRSAPFNPCPGKCKPLITHGLAEFVLYFCILPQLRVRTFLAAMGPDL